MANLNQYKTMKTYKFFTILLTLITSLIFTNIASANSPEVMTSQVDGVLVITPTDSAEIGRAVIAQQNQKFSIWQFLENHPRYQGLIFLGLMTLLAASKTAVENFMPQEAVWKNLLIRIIKFLIILAVIISLIMALITIRIHSL